MAARISKTAKFLAVVSGVALFLILGASQTPEQSDALRPPDSVRGLLTGAWTAARNMSGIEFYPIPLDPPSFPPVSRGASPRQWTIWGQGSWDTRHGRLYVAVGDHGGVDARLHIVEFDPSTNKIGLSPDINAGIGGKPGSFRDGKIHGRLEFYDGPWVWFCTYWAKYPEPDEKDYGSGYRGGHIVRYNVETGAIVDEGVPLTRASWPGHRLDATRGILYASGHFGEFLAWDIRLGKARFAGFPPPGSTWANRVLLLDEKTGMVYSTSSEASDGRYPLVRYEPDRNRFRQLACAMPSDGKGQTGPIRCHTDHRGPDGLFWGLTQNGVLFSFDPDASQVAAFGEAWPGQNRYTTSIARSPGGRYLYYLPGAHGDGFLEGMPLVQFDTVSRKFKVLAFLGPYLLKRSRYLCGGTYSVALDDKGERLFVAMNGAWQNPAAQDILPASALGVPALLVITIPSEERKE